MAERDPFEGWTAEQIAQTRLWVETWRRAGPELERIRRAEIRQVDHRKVIGAFDDGFAYAVRELRVRPSSGLVEQQRIFSRAHRPK